MRVGAIIESRIDVGGGFNQEIAAVKQMARLAKRGCFEFLVYTTQKENLEIIKRLDLKARYVKSGWKEKLIAYCATSPVGRKIQGRIKLIGGIEKTLLRDHIDLVYLTAPIAKTALSLQKLNYIFTIWDLCHRDSPEFPEVREFNQFIAREFIYRNCIAQAYLIICDSPTLVERISRRYGIDEGRLLPMPFSPSPFLTGELLTDPENVLKKYGLEKGYLYYPAQFWPHKNHIRILQALNLLRDMGKNYRVVFTGSDKGNRGYIERYIQSNNLTNQVRILGFVPYEDMHGLYHFCHAVVMPTYFGPTNIPPLEAWLVGKPLIYSYHLQDQTSDASINIDPDRPESIVNAICKLESKEFYNVMVARGRRMLKDIEALRLKSEDQLLSKILLFERRRSCWE